MPAQASMPAQAQLQPRQLPQSSLHDLPPLERVPHLMRRVVDNVPILQLAGEMGQIPLLFHIDPVSQQSREIGGVWTRNRRDWVLLVLPTLSSHSRSLRICSPELMTTSGTSLR